MKTKDLLCKLKSVKGLPLILLGLAAGLLFILLGSIGEEEKAQQTASVPNEELEVYAKETEERIYTLLLQIPEVHAVSVMVTLEGGREYVYAQDANQSGHSYVTVQKDGEQTVFLRENAPVIQGIAVVCPGADATLRLKLTELLCALFDLSYNQIYVTG